MIYGNLGHTGVQVSRLCFGTMSFGGDADEPTSRALYQRCRDAGINFFDTADVYTGGRSETILGKLIAAERDELVIATKAHFPSGKAPTARGSNRYHLVRSVEASLRRLGTDRIDVLYLHHYDANTALDDTLKSLELLIAQGKVLYPAASNFAAWQAMRALGIAERQGWAKLAVLQPMYSLAKRQAEVEILPMAEAMGLGVCSYSPLAGGLLSGKYEEANAQGRLTTNAMYKARYADPAHRDLATRLSALAHELGYHPASLAVAWVASHPAITAPILGARNLDQLEPSLAAADIPMTPELRARISALSPEPPPATDRTEERR
jgi:aryl-alcohol dehydrogenase-like predicted oxidoreductase